jgi:hypothetical protein
MDTTTNDATILHIPYILNKAVSLNDFDQMAIMIKTVTTGAMKYNYTTVSKAESYYLTAKSLYNAVFTIYKDDSKEDEPDIPTFTPIIGNYYKVQIAFKDSVANV